MNDFGKLLYELRREKGWTQGELAEKLGITNQAVSKWENGDSFPETAQLPVLSELFEISIDDLLKGARPAPKRAEEPDSETPAEPPREKAEKRRIPPSVFCGTVMLLATAAFLLLGFLGGLWHPGWIVFIVGAAVCALLDVIGKPVSHYSGAVMLSAVTAYLLLGFLGGLWHPGWVVFLVGAAICAALGATEDALRKKKEK